MTRRPGPAFLALPLLAAALVACTPSDAPEGEDRGAAAPDVGAETSPPPVPMPPETGPMASPMDTVGSTTTDPPGP